MGLMQVNQIKAWITREFGDLIDLSDVKPGAPETQKQNQFLSRALAAYSILCLVENKDKEAIAKSITDGSEDNGIDAIYYDKENKELYLVQSKWNHKGDSEPKYGDIKKFCDGVNDLTGLRFNKFNDKVNIRKNELRTIIENTPTLKLRIVLAYTANKLSSHSKRDLEELLDDYNDSSRQVAFLEIMNQERLHRFLINSNLSEPIDLEIYLTEWGRKDEPKKAYYGQVNAKDVAKWWEKHGDELFSKNIRKLLGNSDINNEIRRTIEFEPENFWYYNNGITMICRQVIKSTVNGNNRSFGQFLCKGVGIINGAQTVGTIGKYALNESDDSNLDNINILLRLISLEEDDGVEKFFDDKFAESVTKKNNRQNEIKTRDFVALDREQNRINKELAAEGINYNVMRSENNSVNENSFDLEESTKALSCAYDIDAATMAHRSTKDIWNDLSNNRYKRLFNPNVTSFYVWNVVRIYRSIIDSIDNIRKQTEDEQRAILIYGEEFICCVVFKIIDTANIERNTTNIDDVFRKYDFMDIVRKVVQLIQKEVNNRDIKNIPNLFKNFSLCRDVFKSVMEYFGNFEQSNLISQKKSIEHLIESKFSSQKSLKNRVYNFDEKISGNEVAEKGFRYWIENIFNQELHECGIVSNILHYLKIGHLDKNDRFILRLKYNSRNLIIEFNFSSYGRDYKSLLYNNDRFIDWIRKNGDEKHRLILISVEDLQKMYALEDFIKNIN